MYILESMWVENCNLILKYFQSLPLSLDSKTDHFNQTKYIICFFFLSTSVEDVEFWKETQEIVGE